MKDILGFEGLYALTEEGEMWSYPKRWKRRHAPSSHKGMWMKCTVTAVGYKYVTLVDKNKKVHKKILHRLMAETFLLNTLEVNHKNGVKTDNRLENLEWVTPSQNAYHAKQRLKVGIPRGERAPNAKLNDDKIREIRSLRKEGWLYRDLATKFGVANSGISRIVNGQDWAHVK